MGIEFWLIVALVLVLGAGHWLLIPGLRDLARRAKALKMWPNLKDEPPWPWTIWPEWTFALLLDLFRRSDQRDTEYLGHQTRVRLGALLVAVGFIGIAFSASLGFY